MTTLLDPRQITNSGPITRRHLVGWACLGLARADVPDIDRLVAKGVALSSPWEVVQVHDRSTSRAFLRCERSQRVVLASVDPVFPVVISHVGAVPLPLRLIDARPDSLAREPSDDP
ncbi:hypothetical protein [Nocardioides sp. BYT-33-1]|uniref:hypothetical protein n=1 Tax=Nocardioides sp. BYT-33-1 TaxID=3416952 RepID=UPI003F53127A